MKNLPVSRTTEILSRHVAGSGETALPDAVVAKARHHVLDSIAACLSGSRLAAGRRIAGHVERFAPGGPCAVVGTALTTSPENAALANGISCHSDETDDSHLRGRFHPGCAILPACLASSELRPVSGRRFLRAFALGYDVGTRINLSTGSARPYDGGHSTHSVGALFGATASSASILRLDPRQVRHALSYAVQQASGVKCWSRDVEHVEKAFDFGGMPARNAMTATTLVAAGLTAVDDSLDGPHDFYSVFSTDPRRDDLVDGLGERFEILDASIKKWCVGSPVQSAIDAALTLRADEGFRLSDILSVEIRLPDDRCALVDGREMPAINAQHLVALALVDGTVTFDSSHDVARMADPAIRRLVDVTRLIPDPALADARPARQSVVSIGLSSGIRLQAHARAVRGTPDDPMGEEEVVAKAMDLSTPVIGMERSRELCRAILRLEDFTDVATMLRPMLAVTDGTETMGKA